MDTGLLFNDDSGGDKGGANDGDATCGVVAHHQYALLLQPVPWNFQW